jgi:hypothetical protein
MRAIIAIAAFAALAACNQQPEAPAAPEAPASLQAQVRAMAAEMQPVFAYQQLVAHLQTQGAVCTGPRGAEGRGTVPANVAPDSIYAPFAGADVYTVQCGEQLTTVRADPRQRWLVVFAPDAMEAQFVNCADATGFDRCAAREIPVAEAAPATTP